MPPLVSVLLPVFNSEKFLSQALTSLSAQSFANFEVIAIDDGSTDRSGDMLVAHAAADRRFVVTRRENRGLDRDAQRVDLDGAGAVSGPDGRG